MAPASLRLSVSGSEQLITVDHVVAGSGYTIDRSRFSILRCVVTLFNQNGAPDPGVYFIRPLSQIEFWATLSLCCRRRLQRPNAIGTFGTANRVRRRPRVPEKVGRD